MSNISPSIRYISVKFMLGMLLLTLLLRRERQSKKIVYEGDWVGRRLCWNESCYLELPQFPLYCCYTLDMCLSFQEYKLEWWIKKATVDEKDQSLVYSFWLDGISLISFSLSLYKHFPLVVMRGYNMEDIFFI